MSRAELATQAELSNAFISQIERNQRNPSIETLSRLAEVLEVPLEALVVSGIERTGKLRPTDAQARDYLRSLEKLAKAEQTLMGILQKGITDDPERSDM